MKKLITIAAAMVLTVAAVFAQPRTVGVKLGADGISATYQHTMPQMSIFNFMKAEEQHITAEVSTPWSFIGGSIRATYDFTNPFNTKMPEVPYGKLDWSLGAGLETGAYSRTFYFYEDGEYYWERLSKVNIGVALHCSVEYSLPFPMSVSVDYYPVLGPSLTFTSGNIPNPVKANIGYNLISLYNFGLSVKYRF